MTASLNVEEHGYANDVDYRPDGKVFATGHGNGVILVWNRAGLEVVQSLTEDTESIQRLVYSPDGKWLAAGGYSGKVHLWDARTGQHVASVSGHKGWVNDLVFHPNGRWLLSASSDQTVALWDLATTNSAGPVESRTRHTSVGRGCIPGWKSGREHYKQGGRRKGPNLCPHTATLHGRTSSTLLPHGVLWAGWDLPLGGRRRSCSSGNHFWLKHVEKRQTSKMPVEFHERGFPVFRRDQIDSKISRSFTSDSCVRLAYRRSSNARFHSFEGSNGVSVDFGARRPAGRSSIQP